MKRIKLSLAFIFAISLFCDSISFAQTSGSGSPSESAESSKPRLKAGEYKDLTWYRAMKLGTAPFVNPGLAENAAVAYRFEPWILSNVNPEDVKSKMEAGVIAIAEVDHDTYRVIGVMPGLSQESIDAIVSALSDKRYKRVLVSSVQIPFESSSLEGKAIVAWQPGATLEARF